MKKVTSIICCLICFTITFSSCEKEAITPIETPFHSSNFTTSQTTTDDLLVPDGSGYITLKETGYILSFASTYRLKSFAKINLHNRLN